MDPMTAIPTPKPKEICFNTSTLVDSEGMWSDQKLYYYTQPNLQFQIIIILGAQQALHFLLRFIGLPSTVSQISVGVAFGALFKLVDGEDNTTGVFSYQSQEILSTVSVFGFVLFLFLTSVKMDPKTVLKRAGRKAYAVGFISVILPILTATITTLFFVKKWYPSNNTYLRRSALRLSGMHSITTFPVIVALLSEMEILTSELGRLAISSAFVGDATQIVLLFGFIIFKRLEEQTLLGFLLLFAILLGTMFLIRPVLIWILKQTPEGRQVKNVYAVAIIIGVLLLTAAMEAFQVLALMTPFLLGLLIPDGPPLGSALVLKLDSLVSGLLMPLFVTTCAMRVNLHQGMLQNKAGLINLVVAAVVLPAKLVACTVVAFVMKLPLRDSFSLALIMCAKGSIDVIALAILKDKNMITEDGFTVMIMMALATSITVPLLVRLLFDSSRHYTAYVRRNVEMLSKEDELPIVICIPRNENIPTFLNFLNAGAPKAESPISLTVIHLVELLGRSTPIFISHFHTVQRKQDEMDSSAASSQYVIEAFRNYKQKYVDEAMSLDMYTSVTTSKLMQGDICELALDKVASLILLPFHVQWTEDGTLDGEDFKLRNLNKAVMERAPCSVGILIDRGNLSSAATISVTNSFSQSYFNIAMMYFGGADDREATMLALRMMSVSASTTLTMIHFKAAGVDTEAEEGGGGDCDAADMELLRMIKKEERDNRMLRYMEEVVKDGPETALILRSIVNEYDLMVVGRREGAKSSALTSGLGEWSEYPELGVIGDLLAVADLETRTSVLVVQQQKVAKTVLR
ncbi:unnamed protein product [Rhodiola kirilowii]